MTIKDHGAWTRYKPETLPKEAPPNALFARRESDGVDWYDYVHPGTNFAAETVKITALWREDVGGYVVGAAVYDATMLFPADHIVAEIDDYGGSDPQKDFGTKLYNPEAGTFADQPPMKFAEPGPTATESKILTALDSIMDRLEKLERK